MNGIGAARWVFAAVGLSLIGCSGSVGSTPVAGPSVPPSGPKQIRHIIVLVQENRSFNNLFADFPGANTTMEGACEPAPWCKGKHVVPLHSVRLESTGQPGLGQDLCASHACFKIECDPNGANVCRMDGFDMISLGPGRGGPPARLYPYAYVVRSETKPYWDLAHSYALADEMFDTDTASSFITNLLLLSGTVRVNDRESLTDAPDSGPYGCDAPLGTGTPVLLKDGREIYPPNKLTPFPCFSWPTVAGLLDAKRLSWLYYIDSFYGENGDYSATWNGFRAIKPIFSGPDWKNISSPNTNVFADIKAGTLPSVSWVVPSLADSDHPASGCNGGPRWVTRVVNAIGTSQYWNSSAIVVVWADWGGWYDNAPPAQINYTSLGFRVPMIVISPYAKPDYVSHTHYDLGTILKFMEQVFNLGSLGTTDASAASMNDMFDFTQPPSVFTPAPLPKALSCAEEGSSR